MKSQFDPGKLITSLTAGLISGVLTITMGIAFAALIFSGPLSGFVSRGISLILLSALIIGVVVALTSSYSGTVARPHEIPAAILALIAGIIVSHMPPAASGSEEAFITVVAAIALTSMATGLFFLILGSFKAGNLIRFIPYPVIGGFLAGTGLLLVKGALGVMTDATITLSAISSLVQPDIAVKWLPGIFLAALLFVILRRRNHFLIMPLWLFFSIGLFYAVILIADAPISEVREQGWLIGSLQKTQFEWPFSLSSLVQVDWRLILAQAGRIGTILILSCISLLLNASGLELVVREEIDLNRELKSVGAANILAGMGGGAVGIHSLSLSALGFTMGAKSRLIGIFSAILCGSVLFWGSSLLAYFPKPVMGAVLMFLGFSFLYQWLYESWFKLPKIDCVLIFLILIVIGVFGFLEGVGVGILVAVVIFVYNYSRVSVVKQALSGVHYHSNVDRSAEQHRTMNEKGDALQILKLQGFIFFGTANNLHETLRRRANDKDKVPLHFAVLDFRFVNGVDSSAVNSFTKMKIYTEAQGYVLIFTALSDELHRQFCRGGFIFDQSDHFLTFPDLDRALEWCENQIIAREGAPLATATQCLEDQLREFISGEDRIARFFKHLEKRRAPEGYYLIHQGDPPHSLYFLESGQVTVQLQNESGQNVRLRTGGPGTVVGELGLYLRSLSTASVITEKESTFYRLTVDALKQMEKEDPEIAAAFHKFMVHRLGERLIYTNRSLQALMD
ncbi:MAG: SLC26A/SulP transporter family protein [Deltaproteobacteria bacterium]|nr:SLC26A/SulP transporter family protein [Deltaproteobacteria bacterium]